MSRCRRALLWIVSVLALPQLHAQLQAGKEHISGAEVFTGMIPTDAGYALAFFVTRPRNTVGKLPVIFEVAWLSCDSVEQGNGPEDEFTQLLWDLASRSGYATVRVDKPGVGRSGGPNCADLDFTTELAAYRTAFAAMKSIDFIDTTRVYILGDGYRLHSGNHHRLCSHRPSGPLEYALAALLPSHRPVPSNVRA